MARPENKDSHISRRTEAAKIRVHGQGPFPCQGLFRGRTLGRSPIRARETWCLEPGILSSNPDLFPFSVRGPKVRFDFLLA